MTLFQQKVWAVCKKIPRGKVTTYMEIAHHLGTKAYRAVGTALNKNPYSPMIPCHRVVNSDGNLGGFVHGLEKKKELLKKEGVLVINNKVLEFNSRLYKFKNHPNSSEGLV